MTIRITGMNSGLDTDAIIQELVSAYRVKGDKIKKQQIKLSWTQDKWKALNTKVLKLYKSLDNMRFSSGYNMKKTSVSDTTKATITASANAVNGSQTLKIKSTAKSGYLTGGQITKSSGRGTKLSALLGYDENSGVNAEDLEGTYRISGNGVTKDFKIDGNTTITKFVNDLNNSDTGIQASYDETNKRIFISSKKTGEDADFALTALDANAAKALKAWGVNMDSAGSSTEAEGWLEYYNFVDGEVDTEKLSEALEYLKNAKAEKTEKKGIIEEAQTENSKMKAAVDYADAAIAKKSVEDFAGSEEDAKLLSELVGMSEEQREKNSYVQETDGTWRAATEDEINNPGTSDIKTGQEIYDKFKDPDNTDEDKFYVNKLDDENIPVLDKDGNPVKVESDLLKQIKNYSKNAAKVKAVEESDDNTNEFLGVMKTAADKETLRTQYTTEIANNENNISTAKEDLKSAEEVIKQYKLLDGAEVTGEMQPNEVSAYLAKLEDRITYFSNSYKKNDKGEYVLKEQSSGANRVKGTNAEIELNGAAFESASNTFNINGLTIQALATTGSDEVMITTATDTQGLYDKIKDFLTEYNSIISEMSSLYNADSAKGYEPLTSEEKEALSESEVADWEKKIKDSLLRRDGNLGSLITSMTAAMSSTVDIGGKKYSLASLGIKTESYFNTTATTRYMYHIDGDADDETSSTNADKLMAMLNSDPDKVMEIMKGVTNKLYDTLNKQMRPTTLRTYQTIYNDKAMATSYSDYTRKISAWEEKVTKIEDDYYKKFSAMESALAKLQSQQSALAGLLGS